MIPRTKWVVVDVEADGPCPGLYSMVSIGAVLLSDSLGYTFRENLHPLEAALVNDASLRACHLTHEQTLTFPPPSRAMFAFDTWLKQLPGPETLNFISDNPAFDWQFVNYYFWRFVGRNPFGFSARRIGDLWCGMQGDYRAGWKRLRDTPHTHDPLDDARGNAEALLKMRKQGLKIPVLTGED